MFNSKDFPDHLQISATIATSCGVGNGPTPTLATYDPTWALLAETERKATECYYSAISGFPTYHMRFLSIMACYFYSIGIHYKPPLPE